MIKLYKKEQYKKFERNILNKEAFKQAETNLFCRSLIGANTSGRGSWEGKPFLQTVRNF